MSRRVPSRIPGLFLLVALAVLARHIGARVPGVTPLVLAVAAGAVVANAVGTPDWAEPGVATHGLLLETAIVLLGARLALDELVRTGPLLFVLVVGTVAFGVVCVEGLCRVGFGVDGKTASLLAAGSSICGVSGVVATARSIDADESQVAYAAGTVLLFDAVTLVAFPLAGRALALPGKTFGVWAGLSMFSTGPVTAAGFAYSELAGRWATLTKVARNSLIGVVAVAYSLAYASRDGPDGTDGPDGGDVRLRALWSGFPKFLLGFLAVAAVANSGLLSAASLASIEAVSDWLFVVAFVGLGFDIRVDAMRDAGLRPVAVVCCYLALVSLLTLAVAVWVV